MKLFKKFASKVGGVFLSIWRYFKDSWEGPDGKFSYRRCSQYAFLVIILKMALKGQMAQYDFYTLVVISSLYLIMALALSVEQIINLVKYVVPLALGREIPKEEPPTDPPPGIEVNVNQKTN